MARLLSPAYGFDEPHLPVDFISAFLNAAAELPSNISFKTLPFFSMCFHNLFRCEWLPRPYFKSKLSTLFVGRRVAHQINFFVHDFRAESAT
jgi:hypothetical protein